MRPRSEHRQIERMGFVLEADADLLLAGPVTHVWIEGARHDLRGPVVHDTYLVHRQLAVSDDLVGPSGIMDLWTREARLFKYGSGTRSNYSNSRAETVPLFAAVLRIRFALIGPLILVTCLLGAYTVAASRIDVILALVFGVVGYLFKKLDYPLAPLVLALVLGDRTEDSFRQSMLMSQGDLSIFFANGLVGFVTTLSLLRLFWPLISRGFAIIRGRNGAPPTRTE